jgi:hypothetical protein
VDDSFGVLVLSLCDVALYLLGIKVLEDVWAWLEVLVELVEELDVVLDGLGPLLLNRCGHANKRVLHLRVGDWVHGRDKAFDLFN